MSIYFSYKGKNLKWVEHVREQLEKDGVWRSRDCDHNSMSIYFSYNDSHLEWVEDVCQQLEKDGDWRCYYRDRNSRLGAPVYNNIAQGIMNADLTVFVTSAVRSLYYIHEFDLALINRKKIVTVQLPGCVDE